MNVQTVTPNTLPQCLEKKDKLKKEIWEASVLEQNEKDLLLKELTGTDKEAETAHKEIAVIKEHHDGIYGKYESLEYLISNGSVLGTLIGGAAGLIVGFGFGLLNAFSGSIFMLGIELAGCSGAAIGSHFSNKADDIHVHIEALSRLDGEVNWYRNAFMAKHST